MKIIFLIGMYLIFGNMVFYEVYKIFVRFPNYLQSKIYFNSSSFGKFLIYLFIITCWFPYFLYYVIQYIIIFLIKYYDK